jgi:hypothetical protein
MFGRRKEEPQGPSSNRYKVESFHSAGKHETMAGSLEDTLNSGEDRGWKLAFITQHAGTFFFFWDTEGSSR